MKRTPERDRLTGVDQLDQSPDPFALTLVLSLHRIAIMLGAASAAAVATVALLLDVPDVRPFAVIAVALLLLPLILPIIQARSLGLGKDKKPEEPDTDQLLLAEIRELRSDLATSRPTVTDGGEDRE